MGEPRCRRVEYRRGRYAVSSRGSQARERLTIYTAVSCQPWSVGHCHCGAYKRLHFLSHLYTFSQEFAAIAALWKHHFLSFFLSANMSGQDIADEKAGATANIRAEPNHETEKDGSLVSSSAVVVDHNITLIYSVLESRSHQIKVAWLYLIATAVLCAWTVSFAYSALVSNRKVPRYYDFSPTQTLRMLNVASVLSILLVKGLVGAVLDALSWALASAPGVTSVPTFRATQNATDTSDLGRLLLTFGKHQKWCIMRYCRWMICLSIADSVYIDS